MIEQFRDTYYRRLVSPLIAGLALAVPSSVGGVSNRPDSIYWRWSYRAPVQFIPLEDLWFYPGDGPCVDGFFYWKTDKFAKRLDLETWRQWGRRKSPPPQERSTRGFLKAIRLEAF